MAQKRFKKAAQTAIATYFDHAKKYPMSAQHYLTLARKTALRYKAPFTKEQKFTWCKKCNSLLIGSNVRFRIHRNKIIRTCMTCKTITRNPIKIAGSKNKSTPAHTVQE